MVMYVVSTPATPWVALFSSQRLDALAEAMAAQPLPRTLDIYASLDGRSRPLLPKDRVARGTRLMALDRDG
jgi:hypothetical protein